MNTTNYADVMSAAQAWRLSWRQFLTTRPRDWREALTRQRAPSAGAELKASAALASASRSRCSV